MTHSVSDEKYGKLRRRLDEVARRVDQGTIPYDPVMSALTLIIEGEIPGPIFSRDMRKEAGWELVEDATEPVEIRIGDLELASFLYQHETFVSGEEMRNRAKGMGVMLGQRHAEYLLGHQEEIPAEWQKYYLVFPGTVWRGRNGGLSVPYLDWLGGRWYLSFGWLGPDFRSGVRLLRPRK